MGDSDLDTKKRIGKFYEKLEMYKNMEEPFTIIIDDPLDNSFVQNCYYPNEDKRMVYIHYFTLFFYFNKKILINKTVEMYDRTYDQNEEFGLNDMKTENY